MDILSLKSNTGNLFRKPELNWGILGTARIADTAISAIRANKNNRVMALASRDLTRGRQFADKAKIPVAYGSYDELIQDSSLQAVYIPLPNSEHKDWTIKALQAGKHVLVEKPFALNDEDAQAMVNASLESGLVLMESFNYRYHSRTQKALEILKKEELGKLRFVDCSFSFPLENPDDFRLVPELGGGALYDLGCYCIDFIRLMVRREPEAVQAHAHMSGSGVDLQLSVFLDFGNQIFGNFEVAFNAAMQSSARIVGTDGVMTLDFPFTGYNRNVSLSLEKNHDSQKTNYRPEDSWAKMTEHFYQLAIKKDIARYQIADSVKNLTVIDAIFQSVIEDGKLVRLTTI